MSHLEAVHGVVGHAHLSPLKVGDPGGPLPSAALGASELQQLPRAGRERAVGGRREGTWGLGSWGLGEGVFGEGNVGNTLVPQRRDRSSKWEWVWSLKPKCVCVSARRGVCLCRDGCICLEVPRARAFFIPSHPNLPFRFLCPDFCSKRLLASFAPVPSLPPPPPLPLGPALPSP